MCIRALLYHVILHVHSRSSYSKTPPFYIFCNYSNAPAVMTFSRLSLSLLVFYALYELFKVKIGIIWVWDYLKYYQSLSLNLRLCSPALLPSGDVSFCFRVHAAFAFFTSSSFCLYLCSMWRFSSAFFSVWWCEIPYTTPKARADHRAT